MCVDYSEVAPFNAVYTTGKCSEDWDNAEVQEFCLKGNKLPDPTKRLPVTSTTTARTYVNHYCAICNDEDPDSLRIWYDKVVCPENISSYKEDYAVMFRDGAWGVIEPHLGIASFTPCSLYFVIPGDIRNFTTPCVPTETTCTHPGSNEHEQTLCQSYTAAVYHDELRFRNKHCASCNGYNEYTCVKKPHDGSGLIVVRISPFAMLLDFTDHTGSKLVGLTGPCGHKEVWDSSFSKCRQIICPRIGDAFPADRCVPLENDALLTTEK